jgi:hypothetical protein
MMDERPISIWLLGQAKRELPLWLHDRRNPVSVLEKRERSLAEAVASLVEEIHQELPAVSTRPIPPYEDEDFTLEVQIPEDMDRDEAMNVCIHHGSSIEDAFGFSILTRVKKP